MARKDRNLTTAFNSQNKQGQGVQPMTNATDKKPEDETVNSNNEQVTKDVTVDNTPTTAQEATEEVLEQSEDNNPSTSEMTVSDVAQKFFSKIEAKKKKQTVEETHTRTTFLFRNDLAKRLDRLAKKGERGFKTEFLNDAIEALLDAVEDKK